MPQPVAELEEPHAVLGRHDPAVLVEVGEISDARSEPLVFALADMAGRCIAFELAEVAGEGDLLFVGDVLVAEDEHGVSVHAPLDRDDFFVAERLAAVYTRDLSCEDRMQRTDRYGHVNRHSPDSRAVRHDFPSHRGAPQPNSIATRLSLTANRRVARPRSASEAGDRYCPGDQTDPGDREFETSSSATAYYFSIIYDVVTGKIHTKAHPKKRMPGVRQRHFGDFGREVGAFGGPIAEARPKPARR
jgi:hypothetical protein